MDEHDFFPIHSLNPPSPPYPKFKKKVTNKQRRKINKYKEIK
jgi:hypothetical protein